MATIKKKKKNKTNTTYTTGSIGLNIDRFNYGAGAGEAPKPIEDYDDFGLSNVEVMDSIPGYMQPAVSDSPSGTGNERSGGEGCCEGMELTEKRETKRYYIRPQGIFCANKADVIKGLIDVGHENCSVYTLKNLTDHDDVHKLTNDDIIYYYDNEVLYDKNHVKVMDYDLFIKHEEERNKISDNGKDLSQAEWNNNYDDRMTQNTNLDEAVREGFKDDYKGYNPFELAFEAYDALGRHLVEGVATDDCAICGEEIDGEVYDADPYKEGCCCEACYLKFVEPKKLGIDTNTSSEE